MLAWSRGGVTACAATLLVWERRLRLLYIWLEIEFVLVLCCNRNTCRKRLQNMPQGFHQAVPSLTHRLSGLISHSTARRFTPSPRPLHLTAFSSTKAKHHEGDRARSGGAVW